MERQHITRRDFLKLLGTAGLLAPLSRFFPITTQSSLGKDNSDKPNFIILLFDTLSARHMSLYGYGRNTTPNIDKIARSSTVFHRHYSSSNFTQPSTASLLTGVYPWTHRSLDFFTPLLESFETNNIFSSLTSSHQSITYTHNIHTANILEQLKTNIDLLKPIGDLAVYNTNKYQDPFKNDKLIGPYASRRWIETFYAPSYSLLLNPIFTFENILATSIIKNRYKSRYPIGTIDRDGYLFNLEDAIDWIGQYTASAAQSFFGYFHLLPPHEAYRPRAEFLGMFANDNFELIEKTEHHFTEGISHKELSVSCQLYDEYIALVDAEFGRLVELLEKQGALDNTYLILTSDHGQLFERGIHGHTSPTLYESGIHIPLIIHSPKQTKSIDVFSLTNIVDLVPTILAVTNQKPIRDCEGEILPVLGGKENNDRIIFSMYSRQNARLKPLMKVTYSAIKWPYKLVTYRGYVGYDNVDELFNLDEDPDELNNLAASHSPIVADLKEALDKSQAAAEGKYLPGRT